MSKNSTKRFPGFPRNSIRVPHGFPKPLFGSWKDVLACTKRFCLFHAWREIKCKSFFRTKIAFFENYNTFSWKRNYQYKIHRGTRGTLGNPLRFKWGNGTKIIVMIFSDLRLATVVMCLKVMMMSPTNGNIDSELIYACWWDGYRVGSPGNPRGTLFWESELSLSCFQKPYLRRKTNPCC